MTKRKWIIGLIGFLVSVAGLIYVFQGVDFSGLRDDFANPALYIWAAPFMLLTVIAMVARSLRTYFLLRHEAKLPHWPLYKITMIGFCYNSILPSRAGEFIRAFLIGRLQGIGFFRAAASLVIARIFDLAMLLLCFGVALWSVNIDPNLEVKEFGFSMKGSQINGMFGHVISLCVVAVCGIVLLLFRPVQKLAVAIIHSLRFLPERFRNVLSHQFESFSSGLRSVGDPLTMLWVFGLTFVNWLIVAVSVWMLQFGFEGLAPINLGQAYAIMILIGFAVMIPSGPAAFGMYEVGGYFALIVLGIATEAQKTLAVSYILALHLFQILPIIVLGLIFTYRDHISIKAIRHEQEIREEVAAAVD